MYIYVYMYVCLLSWPHPPFAAPRPPLPPQSHPRFKRLPPVMTNMWMGWDEAGRSQRDPLAVGFDEELGCVEMHMWRADLLG
jgi:hypothetical protein